MQHNHHTYTTMETTPTYSQAISYVTKVFNETRTGFKDAPTKVLATFKELSRTDKSQHKLAMLITSTMRRFGKVEKPAEDGKPATYILEVDDEILYDLTVRYITETSVFTDIYRETERAEILADAGAILSFGHWALKEKIAPFFSILHET